MQDVHFQAASQGKAAHEGAAMLMTSSPVPKSLLDRLEALSPRAPTRELTSIERAMWLQVILRRYERGDRSPNVVRIVEILSTLRERKALRDKPLEELA
jgi:hypothetical protein